MLLVLSDWSNQLEPSASTRDLEKITETARSMGLRVYPLPSENADDQNELLLSWIPTSERMNPGVWVGFIPTPSRYTTVYEAALCRGIRLLNTPQQHQRAMEFDAFYPLLHDLTPQSVVLTDLTELSHIPDLVPFPLFLKGIVKSQKEAGWKACVATTPEELAQIATRLLQRQGGSRGRIVVREVVSLRHTRMSPEGFPLGREFRVFLSHQQVLTYGYYWEGQDSLSQLSSGEEHAMLTLAKRAAERLHVPYLAVDVGQVTSGDWVIIEVGDAQFSGLSQVSPFRLWNALQGALEQENL